MKKQKVRRIAPLLSWDIYSVHLFEITRKAKIKRDLERLNKLSNKFKWDNNLENILQETYKALVLTDASQIIVWVNTGFTEMTGYPKKYALGKKPDFLQGTNTTLASKESIRENLYSQNTFTTSIINYRKNGEEYHCEVKIVPLKNNNKEITHFLALEKEIKPKAA